MGGWDGLSAGRSAAVDRWAAFPPAQGPAAAGDHDDAAAAAAASAKAAAAAAAAAGGAWEALGPLGTGRFGVCVAVL